MSTRSLAAGPHPGVPTSHWVTEALRERCTTREPSSLSDFFVTGWRCLFTPLHVIVTSTSALRDSFATHGA